MTHGSLFSGIGGFDLAAEWMGWDNIFHCEWMPFPRQVLHYHFPKSLSYEDITKTDFTIHRGTIDILTGGFPCQPYSHAGKRLGKDDERHLWPHMLRAIQEIEPTYVVGENVRGLTNWNGGVVFDEVCTDLEACGYEVQPILLPACAVGAPHRRDRVWFVAFKNTLRSRCIHGESKQEGAEIWKQRNISSRDSNWIYRESNERITSNTNNIRQYECECDNEINTSKGGINAFYDINENVGQKNVTNAENIGQEYALENGQLERRRFRESYKRNVWNTFPSQSPICGGNDGIPTELDGITFSKWRAESIKGYGNAIVPQVAYEIFKVIEQLHYDTISR
jgi:DNA (cytosine-5)-methyltransferase 1